jgi:hypothetical protein
MGPYELDYKALFLSVLKDWRIIAITVAILLAWALLRYVGMVFRSTRLSLPPPRKMLHPRKKAAAATEEIEEEE